MKKALALLALALSAIALVACGGGGDNNATTTPVSGGTTTGGGAATTGGGAATTGGGGGQTLNLSADPNGALKYNTDQLSAKAGKVTIDLNNPATLSHDVAVEDSSGKQLGVAALVAQGRTSVTVFLKPGKYTYFCTVPGHRQGGMQGTLTVK
jgi:plastocyanin